MKNNIIIFLVLIVSFLANSVYAQERVPQDKTVKPKPQQKEESQMLMKAGASSKESTRINDTGNEVKTEPKKVFSSSEIDSESPKLEKYQTAVYQELNAKTRSKIAQDELTPLAIEIVENEKQGNFEELGPLRRNYIVKTEKYTSKDLNEEIIDVYIQCVKSEYPEEVEQRLSKIDLK
jgi:murein tripeptide amidase MpaA